MCGGWDGAVKSEGVVTSCVDELVSAGDGLDIVTISFAARVSVCFPVPENFWSMFFMCSL